MVADKEAETGLMTEDKEVVVTYDYSAELVNVTEVGQKFGPTMVDPEKVYQFLMLLTVQPMTGKKQL